MIMLKKMGHTVEIVNNGKEAVDKFMENKFDLDPEIVRTRDERIAMVSDPDCPMDVVRIVAEFDTEDMVFSSSNTDKTCNRIVSIPIHPFLTIDEINHIIDTINKY